MKDILNINTKTHNASTKKLKISTKILTKLQRDKDKQTLQTDAIQLQAKINNNQNSNRVTHIDYKQTLNDNKMRLNNR